MRRLSTALLGVATAATLAVAGVAVAQSDGPPPPPPGMNDDGPMDMSPDGAPPMPGHRMHGEGPKMGPITRAQAADMADKMFAKLDVNGDGVLNSADRDAMVAKRFAKLDTNGDGVLSLDEFKAAHDRGPDGGPGKWGKGPGGPGGPGEGHMGKRGHRGPGHDGFGGPGMMDKLADTNKDGQITAAEFKAAALARFDKMDANHDGVVTPQERKAAMQQMRERWKDARGDRGGEGE